MAIRYHTAVLADYSASDCSFPSSGQLIILFSPFCAGPVGAANGIKKGFFVDLRKVSRKRIDFCVDMCYSIIVFLYPEIEEGHPGKRTTRL